MYCTVVLCDLWVSWLLTSGGGPPNSNNSHTSSIMVYWLPVQGWLLVSIAGKLYLAITVCVVTSGPYMHYSCKVHLVRYPAKLMCCWYSHSVLLTIIVIIVVHIFNIAHANTTVQHLKKCILRSVQWKLKVQLYCNCSTNREVCFSWDIMKV